MNRRNTLQNQKQLDWQRKVIREEWLEELKEKEKSKRTEVTKRPFLNKKVYVS